MRDVLLSDFPNCRHVPVQVTEDDLQQWKTREGIGLGSSREDVVKAYGEPTHEWGVDSKVYLTVIRGYRDGEKGPRVGDKRFNYTDETEETLNVAEFGTRDEKVSWILLSNND